jgi:hypothetical protein
MKKIIWISLAILLVLPAACLALDGKIAFGCYLAPEHVRAYPDGGLASYRSQVEIGHRMALLTGHLRPFVNLTTLMDQYNDNGSFHPGSIRYTVGIGWEKQLSGQFFFFTNVEHFCWHPVDGGGTVESANYIEVGLRF